MKPSGILGVIIITFIVIFIASITFSHVESIREAQNQKKDQFIEGTITSIQENNTVKIENTVVTSWTVILSDQGESTTGTYQMIFEETYPPLTGLNLRFYYSTIIKDNSEYLWISQIEKSE